MHAASRTVVRRLKRGAMIGGRLPMSDDRPLGPRMLDGCPLVTTNLERVEQHPTGGGHLPYGCVERRLVGLGRSVEATDLANELESGVVELRIARSMVGVPQPFDVPTHSALSSLRFVSAAVQRSAEKLIPVRAVASEAGEP